MIVFGVQVTCFLAGLFSTEQASCALVLAPKSVMRGWEKELERWLVEATRPTVKVKTNVGLFWCGVYNGAQAVLM